MTEQTKTQNSTRPRPFSADYLRRSFLDFFAQRAHQVVPSSPLVPADPTLLFTSAGMVQFKAYYSDPGHAPYPRAASVQKCLRAGGKQSDLENVGRTLRHHTFFEMLGNFSFGDYFKQEAIDWAWELVTEVWAMDRERLWVSVYHDDEEAERLWTRRIGMPAERVVRLGKKDNFWGPVGDTGVCGPSSEIYYDTGPERGCGRGECRPGCDCDRFIEFWNLVFPQFFLDEQGVYQDLPRPGIDTGMGLERVAFILQEAEDNFHTDLFLPVREAVARALPEGAAGPEADTALNVAADHLRALSFAMAEGVVPSNEGRGYILRRLLRRALTKMHLHGVERPFLWKGVRAVVETMGSTYPELAEREEFIVKVMRGEEERFFTTLEQGLQKFRDMVEQCRRRGLRTLAGADVFTLYDTYGFPRELTLELAQEEGLGVDLRGFEEEMARQRERARQRSFHALAGGDNLPPLVELGETRRTEFLGYRKLSCQARVCAYRLLPENGGRLAEILTDRTVFYPEGGGQVGDRGKLRCGSLEMEVRDAYRIGERIAHLASLSAGPWGDEELRTILGSRPCRLQVDAASRRATARNHTATHLLHAALRQVLGSHAVQSGSLVEPERLRFDFVHFQAMTPEEIAQVEAMVNAQVMANRRVRIREVPYRQALEEGVVALFGEKYGEVVRVVEVPGFSKELCGGTHVASTGEIGLFLVKQETAVSSGVRRIEALTGSGALAYLGRLRKSYDEVAALLRSTPEEAATKLKNLLEELSELRRARSALAQEALVSDLERAIAQAREVGGVKLVVTEVPGSGKEDLRRAGDKVRESLPLGVGLLLAAREGKASALVVVSDRARSELGLSAGEIVRRIGEELGLRGGGRPHMAQLGLTDRGDFDRVVASVERYLEEKGR